MKSFKIFELKKLKIENKSRYIRTLLQDDVGPGCGSSLSVGDISKTGPTIFN